MNIHNLKFTPIKINTPSVYDLTSNLHSRPDPNLNYHYAPIQGFYRIFKCCKGFTYIMKLVMCPKKYPGIPELIKKEVLENKENINAQNESGVTALMMAVINSNGESSIEIVRLLIDLGADLEIKSNIGYTALTYACTLTKRFSSFEVVTLLLNRGADIFVRNNCGDTLLMSCVTKTQEYTSEEMIDFLIGCGIGVNDLNNHGKSALHASAENLIVSTRNTIVRLLDNGADPNIIYENNIAFSFIYRNNFFYKKFIDSGLNINFQDVKGQTFIMKLCFDASDYPYPEQTLKFINKLKIEKLKEFYSYGPDLNIVDKMGNTFLMHLCKNNDFYVNDSEFMSDVLIKTHPTLNNINNDGHTVFDIIREKFQMTNPQLELFFQKIVPELNIKIPDITH